MPDSKSARVLQQLWERFERAERQRFYTVSKRKFTTDVLERADPTLMAKWTNPTARGWLIPFAQAQDVANALGASVSQIDDLMLARLEDLMNQKPDHDVVSLLAWFAGFLDRVGAPPPDEVKVLAIYRAVAERFPLGLDTQVLEAGQGDLEAQFVAMLSQSESVELERHDIDRQADVEGPTAQEMEALRQRARQSLRAIQRNTEQPNGLPKAHALKRRLKALREARKRGADS